MPQSQQARSRSGEPSASSGVSRIWERQATAWNLVYRISVRRLADPGGGGRARAAQATAERARALAVDNKATLAEIKEEVDDLEHR